MPFRHDQGVAIGDREAIADADRQIIRQYDAVSGQVAERAIRNLFVGGRHNGFYISLLFKHSDICADLKEQLAEAALAHARGQVLKYQFSAA